jgi:hypothetical protein
MLELNLLNEDMNEFKKLINKKVEQLFLVVWPPWGELNEANINVSFGFVFNDEPTRLCIISVDKDELWSPHISFELLPKIEFSFSDFYHRMNEWMIATEETDFILDYEYYNVTNCDFFEKIINSEIIGIEKISIMGDLHPFGIKILFNEDYIISMPISDGNSVETSKFNRNDNIKNFEKIGKVVFEQLI